MLEVNDLRKKPIKELTTQEITSRLHLINDNSAELRARLKQNDEMVMALVEELTKRNSKK